MHMISRQALTNAAAKHADAAQWLESFWRTASAGRWESLEDVRQDYQSADQIGRCLIFNARGNNYRLICRVTYADQHQRGTLLVKNFLTHAEYDKNKWKRDCE